MSLKGFSRWLNANGHLATDPGARFRTPRLKRTIPILPAFHDLATKLAGEPSLRNRAILAIRALRRPARRRNRRTQAGALLRRPGAHWVRGQGPPARPGSPT